MLASNKITIILDEQSDEEGEQQPRETGTGRRPDEAAKSSSTYNAVEKVSTNSGDERKQHRESSGTGDEETEQDHEEGLWAASTTGGKADPSVLAMSGSGIPIRVVSKYGANIFSNLLVSKTPGSSGGFMVNWRLRPERLGCDIADLKEITRSFSCERRLVLTFAVEGVAEAFEVQFELDDRLDELSGTCWSGEEIAEALYNRLDLLVRICQNRKNKTVLPSHHPENEAAGTGSSPPTPTAVPKSPLLRVLDEENFKAVTKMENCYQLMTVLRWKEGAMYVDKLLGNKTRGMLQWAFKQWTSHVYTLNAEKMDSDCFRWRLHACTNLETDLQAWYHAIFTKEVYRLRGPFWFRDAVLPQYRHSCDLVDQALTPLEEAALAHVLCSPDTTYGDVAGQMMVVQSIVSPELYSLFQHLSAQGAQIIKCPRSGRPAKKMFRFSFVEGNIYLTWRGKFGNQGVDLGDVSSVMPGITTEVMKRTAERLKEDCYLSLNSSGRSVDLCFEDRDERNEWLELLSTLVNKEKGNLVGVELVSNLPATAQDFEWFVVYSCLGPLAIPEEKRQELLAKTCPP